MLITTTTGTVSHLDHATETSGQVTRGTGQVNTAHVWSFRLNNRPAIYKQRQGASFAEGDVVTAAGYEKNGTFYIGACRNETTGAIYKAPGTVVTVLSAMVILISVPMMLLLALPRHFL